MQITFSAYRRYTLAGTLTKTWRVMRLMALLMTAFCIQASATTLSQTVSFSGEKIAMEKVLREVQRQTNYFIIYDDDLLRDAKLVSIDARNVPLKEFMDRLLEDQPLKYFFRKTTIVIEQKTISVPVSPVIETQRPPVSGVIRDAEGKPLSGVNIVNKKTKQGVVSAADGSFSIEANNGDILVISSIGFQSQEYTINGNYPINISLKQVRVALDTAEVVINTGYQKLKPNEITGSVELVTNEELNRRAGTDILSRLEGVTTGVLFDRRSLSPSQPGIDPGKVMIRGLSTITESIKAPLIIVNDFPYDGDINNINPNDVQTITILKDAAAASIWGARAGNGVIVITTGQGKYNQNARLSIHSNFGITEQPDLFHYPRMSVPDFIDAEIFLFNKNYFNGDLSNVRYPAMTPVVEILNNRRNGIISSADSAAQIDALKTLDVRDDFEKYIYRTAVLQQYSLGINGGGQKVKYALSGGFDRNTLNLVGNEFNRLTFRSNTTIVPIKNLELNAGIAYVVNNIQNNSTGELGSSNYATRTNFRLYPYAQFADANGNHLALAHDYRSGYVDTAGGGLLRDWKYRPLDELELADNETLIKDLVLSFSANYRFTSYLNAQLTYQFEDQNSPSTNYLSKETYFTRNQINLYSQIEGGTIKYIIPNDGILVDNNTSIKSSNARAQINFNQTWSKHQVVAFAGGEIRERILQTTGRRVYGYNKEYLTTALVDFVNRYPLYGGRGTGQVNAGQAYRKTTDHFVSYFGNFAYTFDKKYSLSLSGRQDASNLFGVEINRKWKPLWSAGAAWTISNENFYHAKAVSFLKVRATYGYQGNVNNVLSPYTIISRLSFPNIVNEPVATIDKAADPNLTWETIGQLNLAVDFGMFSTRINGSIEYYNKRSKNLIFNALTDPTYGIQSAVRKNSAHIAGQGLEFTLNTTNLNRAFRWSTEATFAYQVFKVTKYELEDNGRAISAGAGLSILPVKGRSPYGVYSFPFAGLDSTNGDPMGYLGKQISKDYNRLQVQSIDTSNLIYHGSGVPPYFGSITNIFSFRGFSLTVNISYRLGHYFRKNTIYYSSLVTGSQMHPDYAKRWQQPGDEKITNIPSFSYPVNQSRDNFYAGTSVNVLKADHIRLEYIRLAYDLRNLRFRDMRINNVQLFAYANNLGMIWTANEEKIDPEYSTGNLLYPPLKTLNIGLRMDL